MVHLSRLGIALFIYTFNESFEHRNRRIKALMSIKDDHMTKVQNEKNVVPPGSEETWRTTASTRSMMVFKINIK